MSEIHLFSLGGFFSLEKEIKESNSGCLKISAVFQWLFIFNCLGFFLFPACLKCHPISVGLLANSWWWNHSSIALIWGAFYNVRSKAEDPLGYNFWGRGIEVSLDRSPIFTPNKKTEKICWINWVIPQGWEALEFLFLLEKALLDWKVQSRTVKVSAITQSLWHYF